MLALLAALLLSALLFALLWRVSVRLQDPSFVDAWWGFGVVVLAWAVWALTPSDNAQADHLVSLASLWGLRLGIHLLWRWRKYGPDRRYAALAETARAEHGLDFARFSLLWVFAPQWALQFVVALPVLLGQLPATSESGLLDGVGWGLAAFGILYETIADWQLARFKADAANSGQVMDRGLWRYSRHPNYFGELCTWWGIWLIAADAGMGLWSLPGPLLLTFLLLRVSGAPTTEPHLQRTKPGYEAYRERTSAFIPWPPRPPRP